MRQNRACLPAARAVDAAVGGVVLPVTVTVNESKRGGGFCGADAGLGGAVSDRFPGSDQCTERESECGRQAKRRDVEHHDVAGFELEPDVAISCRHPNIGSHSPRHSACPTIFSDTPFRPAQSASSNLTNLLAKSFCSHPGVLCTVDVMTGNCDDCPGCFDSFDTLVADATSYRKEISACFPRSRRTSML